MALLINLINYHEIGLEQGRINYTYNYHILISDGGRWGDSSIVCEIGGGGWLADGCSIRADSGNGGQELAHQTLVESLHSTLVVSKAAG